MSQKLSKETPRKKIICILLNSPEVQETISSLARRKKKSEEELWKKAKKILGVLVSDYRHTYIAVAYRIVRFLEKRLYKGIDVNADGLDQVAFFAKDHPLLLLPCHRSHMDYLFLSYVLYKKGLRPPFVAAGINLSFFPAGKILRRTGAYFIRRRIAGGDILYVRLLSSYVRWLLEKGYAQELFIEGGRSRTGKYLIPKLGLLSVQIEAFLDAKIRDFYLVPVSISYERIPEEEAYRHELEGHEKSKETFWNLMRSWKLLNLSYGTIYIRFAPPISAKTYFQNKLNNKEEISELAHNIVRESARYTVVNAVSLSACALLSYPKNYISLSAFLSSMNQLATYLRSIGVEMSLNAESALNEPLKVVEKMSSWQWIKAKTESQGETEITIQKNHRMTLDFHKNVVLHHFMPISLAVLACDSISSRKISEKRLKFLYKLFSHEFLLYPYSSFSHFKETSYKALEKLPAQTDLKVFGNLVGNYLEAYLFCIKLVKEHGLEHPLSQRKVRYCLKQGESLYKKGELWFPENLSASYLQSAFQYFHNSGFFKNPNDFKGLEDLFQQIWNEKIKDLYR